MKRPRIGQTFTNGIDRITDSGEGKIKVHDGYISVGPVTPDALGVKIKATLVEHDRAELHTEEIRPPVDEIGETTDSFWAKIDVRTGKTFSAVIDEVTNEGHGLIYTRSGFINLGPVTPDAEGEYVHALKLPDEGARVKSAKVQPDNYIQKLERLFDYDFSLDFGNAGSEIQKRGHSGKAAGLIGEYAPIDEVRVETTSLDEAKNENAVDFHSMEEGDMFSAEVSRLSSSGNGIIDTVNGHVNLGPVPDDVVGETIQAQFLGAFYAIPVSKDMRGEDVAEWLSNSQIDLSNIDDELIPVSVDTTREISGSDTSTDEVKAQSATTMVGNGFENGSRTDTELRSIEEHESDRSVQTGLEELRQKAEEDSVEEIPADTTTYTLSKQEYTRSPAIREYVKARADGVCEACDSPAPFENRDGDPYLHAHHIHELSDGGSDTINSVAAVCPNCHYRIHHGRNGDEYNQELLERIKAIESEK